jgi:hypothetical protein
LPVAAITYQRPLFAEPLLGNSYCIAASPSLISNRSSCLSIVSIFRVNSTMKMEALLSFEMLKPTHQAIRWHDADDQNMKFPVLFIGCLVSYLYWRTNFVQMVYIVHFAKLIYMFLLTLCMFMCNCPCVKLHDCLVSRCRALEAAVEAPCLYICSSGWKTAVLEKCHGFEFKRKILTS